jgi:hypothetical protein
VSANESVHKTAVACDLQSVEENVHDAGGILSACKKARRRRLTRAENTIAIAIHGGKFNGRGSMTRHLSRIGDSE